MLNKIRAYKDSMVLEPSSSLGSLAVLKLSGVSFDGRQENLRYVNKYTLLKLERQRRNPHDFYAVMVKGKINDEWKELGFIPAHMNRKISSSLDSGVPLKAKVWRKVGGEGDYYHGLSIVVERGINDE